MKVLLLVGGMGTRLRSVVSEVPKPLASLGDGSFLELLLLQLKHQELRNVILCTGYLSELVEREFGDGSKLGMCIEYSRELAPMGTAGAVKLARRFLHGAAPFLVMNGDSFVDMHFADIVRFHQRHGTLVSMAVRQVENASRYGTVEVDSNGRVTAFREKTGAEKPGLINAGVYVFERSILDHIPEGPSSLEKDVFPRLLGQGIYALEQRGVFIDIGTPDDYAKARAHYSELYKAVQSPNLSGSSQ